MFLSELLIAHKMLGEKVHGVSYLKEFLKLLNPISWKLFHMRNIDQSIWKSIKLKDPTMVRTELAKAEHELIAHLQIRQGEILKQIVKSRGPITISKYGLVASHSAWLILQHYDADNDFRRKYLSYMKSYNSDFLPENIQMLQRRVMKFN